MDRIAPAMITQGAAVKDSPTTNPVDLILSTNADPIPAAGPVVYTAITQNNVDTSVPEIVPNTAIVDAGTADNKNILLIGAAGLGALLLFSADGKKAMNGITGIGKKGKKDKNLLPLLLVGGVAAYWYFTKDATPAATNTTNTTTDTTTITPGLNVAPDYATVTPEPPTAYMPDPSMAIQPLPSDTTIYNLLYAYSVPWRYAVDRMSTAERVALYTYIWAYMKKGLHLYNFAGNYQDGYFDHNLYADVLALSNKWQLGLLY